MKNYKYTIYRPGGNDTALVETLVLDSTLKRLINDKIMEFNPTVEQVGFIDFETKRLEMAGGEFCGNATRCAAFRFLNGKPGSISIKTSGVRPKLATGIDSEGNTWAQMPIYTNASKIIATDRFYVVPLRGITQVVMYRKAKFSSQKEAKVNAVKILRSLKLDVSKKASGVMFVIQKDGLIIEPIVWVRDIKTLFYETACASGTTAVALVEALKRRSSIKNLPIVQPSGAEITASVDLAGSKFSSARISGPVRLVGQGTIYV